MLAAERARRRTQRRATSLGDKRICVIENEFGEINIDEKLVSENMASKEMETYTYWVHSETGEERVDNPATHPKKKMEMIKEGDELTIDYIHGLPQEERSAYLMENYGFDEASEIESVSL